MQSCQELTNTAVCCSSVLENYCLLQCVTR